MVKLPAVAHLIDCVNDDATKDIRTSLDPIRPHRIRRKGIMSGPRERSQGKLVPDIASKDFLDFPCWRFDVLRDESRQWANRAFVSVPSHQTEASKSSQSATSMLTTRCQKLTRWKTFRQNLDQRELGKSNHRQRHALTVNAPWQTSEGNLCLCSTHVYTIGADRQCGRDALQWPAKRRGHDGKDRIRNKYVVTVNAHTHQPTERGWLYAKTSQPANELPHRTLQLSKTSSTLH